MTTWGLKLVSLEKGLWPELNTSSYDALTVKPRPANNLLTRVRGSQGEPRGSSVLRVHTAPSSRVQLPAPMPYSSQPW